MLLQQNEDHSYINKKSIHYQLYIQFFIFILLFVLDIAINSSVEYDNIRSTSSKNNDDPETATRNIQIILFGIQIILQVFVFVNLFIAFSHTFLFQVGIISVCIQDFIWTLMIHPLYIFLTIFVTVHRVNSIRFGNDDFWKVSVLYIPFSIFQKIVAPFYYTMNLRSLLELGRTKYHSKHAWIRSQLQEGEQQEEVVENTDIFGVDEKSII